MTKEESVYAAPAAWRLRISSGPYFNLVTAAPPLAQSPSLTSGCLIGAFLMDSRVDLSLETWKVSAETIEVNAIVGKAILDNILFLLFINIITFILTILAF